MKNKNEILKSIQGGLIVSCQALENEPLYSSYIMGRMAYAAYLGGACGIRANTVKDIQEIKTVVDLPIIGIIKKDYPNCDVYITPTVEEVDALVACGVEIIAIDATNRMRPFGVTLDEFFKEVRDKYPEQLFMADCSNLEEGIHAAEIGFDLIGTTMSGYTPYTKGIKLPNLEMMRGLVERLDKPVIAEGGVWTGEDLQSVYNTGIFAAVVGSAITRPRDITKHFKDAVAISRTNLGFKNIDNMHGDNDGPAYVVYSKIGYNKASFDISLNKAEINMSRKSDGKWANSYIFLGVDVYDESEQFLNCIDAGLCYSGETKNWHLFYNLYKTTQEVWWYESSVKLDPTHKYQLVLDCSKENGVGVLTIIDMTEGNKIADSAEFEVMYAKADGSNLSMYQDYAIDFPENMKGESADWEDVVLNNTDEGIFLKNIEIHNAMLYTPEGGYIWNEGRTRQRFMWPNVDCHKVDYVCTRIVQVGMNSELILDLDMNRCE